MLPPVFNTLLAHAPLVALVGNRIFRHASVPKGTRPPYVSWFAVNTSPENTLSELPGIDRCTIQVDVWADGSDGDRVCEQIAEAVRDAIEPYAHGTSAPIDARDQETRYWRMGLEFDWFQPRSA